MQPNKAIAEHYESYTVATLDGELITGLIKFQDDKEIVLRDPSQPGHVAQRLVLALENLNLITADPTAPA